MVVLNSGTLQKQLFILKPDSQTSIRIGKLTSLDKVKTALNESRIFDVDSLSNFISQNTVSTSVAPINARENLYYFNLVPGYRNNKTITLGIIPGGASNESRIFDVESLQKQLFILKTSPNESRIFDVDSLSNFISQNTVSTSTAPINARENLYYFNLVPGYRNNKTITEGVIPGGVSNESRIFDVDLMGVLTSQNTVSTSTAPINARENLYYFNLAPGYRNNKTITLGIIPGGVSNESRIFDVDLINRLTTPQNKTQVFSRLYDIHPINTHFSQNTVSTSVAPINARENLYYFNLAPGYRNNKTITLGITPGGVSNEYRIFDVDLIGVLTSQNTVSTSTAPINARENLYYFNLAPGYRNNKTITLGIIPGGVSNESVDVDSLSNFISQNTVSTSTAPINARENLYYFNLAPGYRNNKTITLGIIPGGVSNESVDVESLQKQLFILKPGNQISIRVGKLNSTRTLKNVLNESIYFDTKTLRKQLFVLKQGNVISTQIGKLKSINQLRSFNLNQILFKLNSINILKIGKNSIQDIAVTSQPKPPIQFWS